MKRRRQDEKSGEKIETGPPSVDRDPFFSSLFGSLCIHAVIFLLAFWAIQSSSPVGNRMGGRQTETVGIVFSDEGGGNSQTEDDGDRGDSSESDESAETAAVETPEAQDRSNEADKELSRIGVNASSDTPMVTIHGGSSGLEVGRVIGSGPGAGGGTGQTVGFGELKGRGRRFVYVLDRSESMRWPNDLPIRYALAEAKASVNSLDPKKGALKFQLIYYNHEARAFGNGRLMDVSAANSRAVSLFLDSIPADGGTDPLTALEKAIALKPDVIFFLTDADEEIPPMVLARIRQARLSAQVDQIHVMEFGRPDAKRLHSFRRLAEQNNGLYIFKDVTGAGLN